MEHQAGYYDVKTTASGNEVHHRVYAQSDYEAAVRVRKITGLMPASESDVMFMYACPPHTIFNPARLAA